MGYKHKKEGALSLLPFLIFIVVYLGAGIYFQMQGVEMAFYQFPSVTAMFIAVLSAFWLGDESLHVKFGIFARGAGNENVMTMLMIYILAGAFSAVAAAMGGRDATVNLGISLIPAEYLTVGIFIISAFMGTATGTSMGTVAAIVPIAAGVAVKSGIYEPLMVAACVGGAMFGDNLSFISDTTIAACNGQGCQMKDKFRENFFIALPAAVMTLVVIAILSFRTDIAGAVSQEYHLLQIVPYILVLFGGIAGINVFVVLIIGIISGTVIMLARGNTAPYDLLTNMGSGASGMFETCMVAVLVAAMCALIREYGGFDALLSGIYRTFRGKRGGLLGMGLLVGLIDIATANNTVAIVMANPIAKEMAQKYDITPRKTASILDTFSCIFQGMIPYGAQMLVAISAVHELGHEVSAFNILPYLFYPMFLLVSSLVAVFVVENGRKFN